jgi:hypothetical protein
VAVKFKYLVVFVVTMTACGDRQGKQMSRSVDQSLSDGEKITQVDWIEGLYEYATRAGTYTETWKKTPDAEYIGHGWFLRKGDTLFSMKMRLYVKEGMIKMDYNVKGQNEGRDVEFALTKKEPQLYVFENPFRGFPSIMQYKFMGDTAIHVIERGFENNEAKEQDFVLKRIR